MVFDIWSAARVLLRVEHSHTQGYSSPRQDRRVQSEKEDERLSCLLFPVFVPGSCTDSLFPG